MIISHEHKFIFLKTRKTAGTSVEIALSGLCGGDDVVTPIAPDDEAMRHTLGVGGPRNCVVPMGRWGWRGWSRALGGKLPRFFNHAHAAWIRDRVGPGVWDEYFTFCFERNPFDRAASLYFYLTEEPRPPVATWLRNVRESRLTNWWLYTIDDEIAVDVVCQYERLREDVDAVCARLGLPAGVELPRAKGRHRPPRTPYQEVLGDEGRAIIERVCAREIEAFGYQWETG